MGNPKYRARLQSPLSPGKVSFAAPGCGSISCTPAIRFVKALVDHGYGNRVMFGSDQMVWPGLIEPAIRLIEQASFLTAKQKCDIFYNNAARFLRLSKEKRAEHDKL